MDYTQNDTMADSNDFSLAQIVPHCPVMLVLDTSHSMWGKGLQDMMQSLQTFYATLRREEFQNAEIDIAAVSMGDNLGMLEEFVPFRESTLPQISIRPKGDTPVGAALALALQKLQEQSERYIAQGYQSVTPQLILLSDGKRSSDDYVQVAGEIRHACEIGKLICRAIAMGDAPNHDTLATIAGDNIVYPQYGELRNAFATVGKQVSETYEAEAETVVKSTPVPDEIRNEAEVVIDVPSVPTEEVEYLLDGSNILRWDEPRNGISLKYVLAITEGLERAGKPFQVLFDATAKYILERKAPHEVQTYNDLLKNHAEHFHQVPAGTQADDFLLQLADIKSSRVIMSNDLYRDHERKHPWLKTDRERRLLPGMVLGNTIFFPNQSMSFPVLTTAKG